MNKHQRHEIDHAVEQLAPLIVRLKNARADEQGYSDTMPAGPSQGKRCAEADVNVALLDLIISKLEEAEQVCKSIEGGK